MKKAIVIGATSGIGKELARILAKNNYIIGLVGRRVELLSELQREIPTKTFIKKIDISKTKEAMKLLGELIKEMQGMDLIIISSAVSYKNPKLDWSLEKETVEINVRGFVAMVNIAVKNLSKQNSGHIVGISSIVGFKYSSRSTIYCASKAFVSNYLRGLRENLINRGLNVNVTEIIPGFVDTPMLNGRKGMFWVSSPKKAARQIYNAIKRKKKKAYITKRWVLVALLLKTMPDFIKGRF